jgi:hypothetical protein
MILTMKKGLKQGDEKRGENQTSAKVLEVQQEGLQTLPGCDDPY